MALDHLNSQDLADIFGVSLQTIHNWVRDRALPHHRTLGGQLRFCPRRVRAYCEEHEVPLPEGLEKLTDRWQR